jgi:putative sterol carrier protein
MTEQQQPIDQSAVDPGQFVAGLRDASDEQLAEVMRGDLRKPILDGIFEQMGGHFQADKARGTEAVVHWQISDRPDGGVDRYELVIENGGCRVSDQPELSPRTTFKVGPVHFLRLIVGDTSGPKLFMTGRLKIEGDVMFAAGFQGLFRLPDEG